MNNNIAPNRDSSPYEMDKGVDNEIIQQAKDFLELKIKEAYFADDCVADVLTSTSSYPYIDEYEMDDEDINGCIKRAFKEILEFEE